MLRRLSQALGSTPPTNEATLSPSLSSPAGPRIAATIQSHSSKIGDDSLLKIVRQLDFWSSGDHALNEEELMLMAERLCRAACWRDEEVVIPKVRFGRTEVMIPIVTCGGMRLQET